MAAISRARRLTFVGARKLANPLAGQLHALASEQRRDPMSERYREQSWSIVPTPWTVTRHDECATLEPATRDAALQLSSYRKPNGLVTDEDVAEFAADSGHLAAAIHVTCGDFRGLTAAYEEADAQWRAWWLAAGAVLLYATYNGTKRTATRDARVIDRIVSTLRYEPNATAR